MNYNNRKTIIMSRFEISMSKKIQCTGTDNIHRFMFDDRG